MNVSDAMQRIAEETGMTFALISRAMGHGHTYISSTLGRGRCPSFDNVNDMAKAAGFSICFVRQGEEPDGSLVVDESLGQKKLTAKEKEERARRERERRRKALRAELERLEEMD